jgi:hypothetical protein
MCEAAIMNLILSVHRRWWFWPLLALLRTAGLFAIFGGFPLCHVPPPPIYWPIVPWLYQEANSSWPEFFPSLHGTGQQNLLFITTYALVFLDTLIVGSVINWIANARSHNLAEKEQTVSVAAEAVWPPPPIRPRA